MGEAVSDGRRFPVRLRIDDARNAQVDYPEVPVWAAPFVVLEREDGIELLRDTAGGPRSSMRLRADGDALSGSFNGAGIEGAELTLKRDPDPAPWLREQAIEFVSEGLRLQGTVVWPEGEGPFPAIVVTHGSGPGHREQALYRTEAFRYARLGVVALIYDKRGCGQSDGDYRNASLEQLADDALRGVDLLSALDGIDATRIGIAGHSQGGWIAPLAAMRSDRVAFVIATSASGLGPMDQSLFHNANTMRARGHTEAVIERAQTLRRGLYGGVRDGRFSEELETALATAAGEAWFDDSELPRPRLAPVSPGERALLLFEPMPIWRRVRVPVLAIWGEADVHLPASRSRDLIGAALREGGNQEVELHVLAGLDHGFMPVRDAEAPHDFPRGSRRVETLIADWIARYPKHVR